MEANDMAAIREALEELVANIEMRASTFDIFAIIDRKTFLDAKTALAKPPRNCDEYNDEVLATQAFMEARPHNCYTWSCADLIHWMLDSCKKRDEMEAGKAGGVCRVDTKEGGAECRAEG